MVYIKSQDDSEVIAALLRDVSRCHGFGVFNARTLNLTLKKVKRRLRIEGMGFLTKTLPRLGKTLDRALTGDIRMNCDDLGFKPQAGTTLPRFLGEYFNRIFRPDGALLDHPCTQSVRVLRQILYLYYKYELPYTDEQEQKVLTKFKETESELYSTWSPVLKDLSFEADDYTKRFRRREFENPTFDVCLVREARIALSGLFSFFSPRNIIPRHGPGAVATKQQLSEKFVWTNVSSNITSMYPLDEYFYTNLDHVCDRLSDMNNIDNRDLPARVILVPKDSRGPRLISTEPVDYQWIQQGLGRAIVDHVESHSLTAGRVNFSCQAYNKNAALAGSADGSSVTLDLNEASDRVSLELVRLLFPEHLCRYLEACRSSSTVLPNGEVIMLSKFAPMGSCLCFPVLALTIWAILYAGAPDEDTRKGILVYGDDVIVPTAYAADAMSILESFGLKINRDKSCTKGFFRESCGTDAFKGVDVTPVRFRTVWSSDPSPERFASWASYACSMWDLGYWETADLISKRLVDTYGPIPERIEGVLPSYPVLPRTPEGMRPIRKRFNKSLQRLEYAVLVVQSPSVIQTIDGWSMLLRYVSEQNRYSVPWSDGHLDLTESYDPDKAPFSVSRYTKRRSSILKRRWR